MAEEIMDKSEITIDDFDKLDIQVGKILECVKVPRTKKLLQFTVQVARDTRTIVSSIADWYAPEDLVGKNVLVLANLKPRTVCGIESRGMILSAEDDQGGLECVTVTRVGPGAFLK